MGNAFDIIMQMVILYVVRGTLYCGDIRTFLTFLAVQFNSIKAKTYLLLDSIQFDSNRFD